MCAFFTLSAVNHFKNISIQNFGSRAAVMFKLKQTGSYHLNLNYVKLTYKTFFKLNEMKVTCKTN